MASPVHHVPTTMIPSNFDFDIGLGLNSDLFDSSLSSTTIPMSHAMFTLFFDRIQALKEKFKQMLIEKERLERENHSLSDSLKEQTQKYSLLENQLSLAFKSHESTHSIHHQLEVQIVSLQEQVVVANKALEEKQNTLNLALQERDLFFTWKNQLETSLREEMTRAQVALKNQIETQTHVSSFELESTSMDIQLQTMQVKKSLDSLTLNSMDTVSSSSTSAASTETLCEEKDYVHNDPAASFKSTKETKNIASFPSSSILLSSNREKSITSTEPSLNPSFHEQKAFSKSPTKKKPLRDPSSQAPKPSSLSPITATSSSHFTSPSKSSTYSKSNPTSPTSSQTSSHVLESELRHTKAELQHVQDQLRVLYGQLGAALSTNELLESQLKKLKMTPTSSHGNYLRCSFEPNMTDGAEEKASKIHTESHSSLYALKKNDWNNINEKYQTQLQETESLKNELYRLQSRFQTCLCEKKECEIQVKALKHQESEYLTQLEECMQHKAQLVKKYETEQQTWAETFHSLKQIQEELKSTNETLIQELHKIRETHQKRTQTSQHALKEAHDAIQTLTFNKNALLKELKETQGQCEQLRSEAESSKLSHFDTSDLLQTLQSEFLLLEKSYLAQIEHLQCELHLAKDNMKKYAPSHHALLSTPGSDHLSLNKRDSFPLPHHADLVTYTRVPNDEPSSSTFPSTSPRSPMSFQHTSSLYTPLDMNILEDDASMQLVPSLQSTSTDPQLYPAAKALVYLKKKWMQSQLERDQYRFQLKSVYAQWKKERDAFFQMGHVDWAYKVRGYKRRLKKQQCFLDALVQQKVYLTKVISQYQRSETATWAIVRDLGLPFPLPSRRRPMKSRLKSAVYAILFVVHLTQHS